MKEKALFYLRRHIKMADAKADLDHEMLAKQGVPIASRRALSEKAALAGDEAEALRFALECVKEHGYKPLEQPTTRAEIEKERDEALAKVAQARIDGLTEYAWWKDGVQYVGTCGTTLKQAIARLK